jgi:peptidoglycan/LPS O-acetylase OafA/YrhL
VAGFFILSEFLIAKSWVQSSSLREYLRRRVLRIYPGFLAASAFCALVVGPLAADRPSDYWRDFSPSRFTQKALTLKDVAMPPVFGTNPGHHVNGSLWTIRYEFVCYLGVAALGLAGALRRPALVFLVFLGCASLHLLWSYYGFPFPGERYVLIDHQLRRCVFFASNFLAGMLFYLYRDQIAYSFSLFAFSLLGLAAFVALPGLHCLPLAISVLGGYSFFYLGFLPVPRLQGFAQRGDLSYGTYLYAYPIQQLTVYYLGPGLHPLALFLIATPLALIFAAMSWTFVEKPFIRLKATKPTPFTLPLPSSQASPERPPA